MKEDENEDWDDIYEANQIYEPKKDNSFQISAEKNLLEKIIDQIHDLDLKPLEKTIAEEIIYNLDDRGYLSIDLFLIADRYGKTVIKSLIILVFKFTFKKPWDVSVN